VRLSSVVISSLTSAANCRKDGRQNGDLDNGPQRRLDVMEEANARVMASRLPVQRPLRQGYRAGAQSSRFNVVLDVE
jgi:hypothetical protein